MENNKRVVIIGTGVGGLAFAINLKRQLPFCDFTIFEKASEIGGTWRDNVYPGCSSDIDIHFYSLSTDLKADWNSTHGSQKEIQDYWIELTKKYDLYPHIVFNTRITRARWDVDKQRYHIEGENVMTGAKTSTTAEILVSAIGVLEIPRYPDIPGLSAFKGSTFHSARWRDDVELVGKRVGVIGNGASATQFVPAISRQPSVQVTQFCRTPNWLLPPIRSPFSPAWKWAFAHLPFFMRLYRITMFFKSVGLYMIFSSSTVRWLATKWSQRYMLKTAPKYYHDTIIPRYPMGCKRILFDTDFLNALHRPNMRLVWDGIAEVVENGIITKKGEKIPLDVIIMATGFDTDHFPIDVYGNRGQTVQDYYDAYGAPRAYLGTTLPGFPNFYMISGPNTATGHTSVIYSEELQIDYCMHLIKPVLQGKVSSFEVTSEATDSYNALIQARLARSVFVHCNSWYRKGGDGINSSIFPGSPFLHWWWLRKPVWRDYKVVKGEAWRNERSGMPVGGTILAMLFAMTGVCIAGRCFME